MLSKKIQDAYNEQLIAEQFSAHLYLSMSAYFQSINLKGMGAWMKLQAEEESSHGMMFFDQILARGGEVTLGQIDAPQSEWDSPLEAFEAAYGHEQGITSRINALVDLSIAESDHAANAFLQWFVKEQVEEEDSVRDIADQLRLVGDDRGALFMLDRELGQRTAAIPQEE